MFTEACENKPRYWGWKTSAHSFSSQNDIVFFANCLRHKHKHTRQNDDSGWSGLCLCIRRHAGAAPSFTTTTTISAHKHVGWQNCVLNYVWHNTAGKTLPTVCGTSIVWGFVLNKSFLKKSVLGAQFWSANSVRLDCLSYGVCLFI